jgi:adenosylcobinamide amidohydrolase
MQAYFHFNAACPDSPEVGDNGALFHAPRLTEGPPRLLVVPLGGPHDVLSWAIVNGGRRQASAVVWREVALTELGPDVDPTALLRDALADADLPAAVGLLTARDVRTYEEVARADHDPLTGRALRVRCVTTVGLANALAVGDPPAHRAGPTVGTINVLCQISTPLSEEALVEALALAAEARTAAMLDARVPSLVSGRMASGTGTDCIVVAAPALDRPGREALPPIAYAGKHTALGALIGETVREAVGRGVARRLEVSRPGPRPVSTEGT